MNLNFDNVIKQEFLSVEEEVISGRPMMDLNIPVKSEPIFDDSFSSVTIKSEPLHEQSFLQGAITIKSENSLQNQEIVKKNGNNFIIYELETPRKTDNIPRLLQQKGNKKNHTPNIIQNKKVYRKSKTSLDSNLSQSCMTNITAGQVTVPTVAGFSQIHTPNIIHNKEVCKISNLNQSNAKNITVGHVTVPTVPASPPVLLNTQLRKRHKVILPVSAIDKRKRYNIQGTKPEDRSINSNASSIINSDSKKIINHLMNHKVKLRKAEENCVSKESATITRKEHNQFTEKPVTSLVGEKIVSPVSSNHLNKTTEVQTQPEIMNQVHLSSSKQAVGSPIISEIRVKCLCSLTDNTSTDNTELKAFFKEMYEDTRRLSKSQQRSIKMLLLKAISDAEESMERGKCCGF